MKCHEDIHTTAYAQKRENKRDTGRDRERNISVGCTQLALSFHWKEKWETGFLKWLPKLWLTLKAPEPADDGRLGTTDTGLQHLGACRNTGQGRALEY